MKTKKVRNSIWQPRWGRIRPWRGARVGQACPPLWLRGSSGRAGPIYTFWKQETSCLVSWRSGGQSLERCRLENLSLCLHRKIETVNDSDAYICEAQVETFRAKFGNIFVLLVLGIRQTVILGKHRRHIGIVSANISVIRVLSIHL